MTIICWLNCECCWWLHIWMVMINWKMNGDKHVYVMLFIEHVKCWMLVVNSYMLNFMVILLVNACMQNDGDDVENCLCEHMYCVESYVHAFMTDGGGFYIQLRWLRCFCCIEADDLEVIWYRMYLEESRTSHAFDLFMSRVIIEYVAWWIVHWWNLVNVWLCGLVYMYIGGFCWWL
jgi:hypothetical protein